MSILEELLEKIKTNELDEQLRIVCDQIKKEENINSETFEGPNGVNVFLALLVEIPKSKTEDYICIEREMKGVFIFSHWSCLKSLTIPPKRIKAWSCKEVKTDKILKEFVERIKFIKGE